VPQAALLPTAARPALAAQFTGLYLAMAAIQPGTSRSDRKAPDRKVSHLVGDRRVGGYCPPGWVEN
jgi:hypothetical protein